MTAENWFLDNQSPKLKRLISEFADQIISDSDSGLLSRLDSWNLAEQVFQFINPKL